MTNLIRNLARLPKAQPKADKQRKNSEKPAVPGIPFVKDDPRINRLGRPKSITLSEAARAKLKEPMPNDPKGRTFAEVIIDSTIHDAALKDRHAREFLRKLTEGDTIHVKDWRQRAEEAGIPPEQIDKLGITIGQIMTGQAKIVRHDTDG